MILFLISKNMLNPRQIDEEVKKSWCSFDEKRFGVTLGEQMRSSGEHQNHEMRISVSLGEHI